jgi:predicted Zn-dependent protease
MKPIKNTLLCAMLALAFGIPAQAAGDMAGASKRARPTTREVPAAQPSRGSGSASPDRKPGELTGQVVYQVLLAEVALQRGKNEFASQAYADLAVRTRDPAVIARAIEVASYARRFEVVQELARLWIRGEPESKRAQQVLVGVMIMSNQLEGLAPELIRMLDADKASLPANLLGLNRMFARTPDRQAVLQLVSKVCTPYFGLAEAHYAVAVAASSAGENERALGEVRKALELRPDWETAALLEAQILASKSSAAAIASLQGFVERYPKAREVQLHLARALVGEKRYAEAKRQFELLLQAYPNNPDVVYPVALLALQENDQALAEAQLKHLVTLEIPDKSAPILPWTACRRKQAPAGSP